MSSQSSHTISIFITVGPQGIAVDAQLPPVQTPEEAAAIVHKVLSHVLEHGVNGGRVYDMPAQSTTQ